jgi:thiamine-phosphate pyrophosphorylase
MRLHALVASVEIARRAAEGGATIIQLRCKGAAACDLVALGQQILHLGPELVINDNVEAAIALGVTVHLGQSDAGIERAKEAGIPFGLSVSTLAEALAAQARGARYIGVGPIWATPSKLDAAPAIGLEGLRGISRAVSIPVIAIGGIEASNAADCIRAGADGVAVIRAIDEIRALRAVMETSCRQS